MRLPALLLGLVICVLGCDSATSTTDLAADGGFKRTVRISATKTEMPVPGTSEEKPTEPGDLVAWAEPETWSLTMGEDDKAKWLEAARSFAPGASAERDFSLVHDGVGYVDCQVRVVRRDDGMLEYTETFTSTTPEEPRGVSAEFKAEMQKQLGGLQATEDEMASIENDVTQAMYWTVFGPADPILGLLVTNPEGALRRIRIACGRTMLASLEKHLGDRIDETKAREVTREMLKSLDGDDVVDPDKPSSVPGTDESSPDPIGITTIVRGPGRVVETNGIEDPVTGEVFWSLYNVSPKVGPVVLRVVYQP